MNDEDRTVGQPNDIPGICTGPHGVGGCGARIPVGKGVWEKDDLFSGPKWRIMHAPGTACRRGWVYIAPGVGPGRDLTKVGMANREIGLGTRMRRLYEYEWKLLDFAKPSIWAANIPFAEESEGVALRALLAYRAYPLLDPSHPLFADFMETHPRPPPTAEAADHLSWIYANRAKATEIRKSSKKTKHTPGWTELFQGDSKVLVALASKAIGVRFQEFRYCPMLRETCLEKVRA